MKGIEEAAIVENELTEIEAKEAHKITDEIIKLHALSERTFMEIGARYRDIRDRGLFRAYGCRSFMEYVAMPELGYALSTVQAYIQMFEKVQEFNIDVSEFYKGLSYDKFRAIIPHLTDDNKEEMLSKARSLSKSALILELSGEKKNEGFSDYKPVPPVFRCRKCGGWIVDVDHKDICPGH